ncbi:MAG TPA: nuclear transport factor 2 family protein [Gammaproteobacteria bacterium]|nr:nuclear transport factor 2 family protein [Gammaproteobacteria bacterium]
MSSNNHTMRGSARIVHAVTVSMAMLFMFQSQPLFAQQVTMETLLDRIQIEDILTRYYYDLSLGNAHELSEYFTADALLDVDGTVAKGHAEIAKLYQRPEPGPNEPAPEPGSRAHMLLTNPIIEINGDTATAHVIWTGVMNEGIGKLPHIFEQGREDTELVKQNGKWLIKRRYITADGRMPNRFDTNYKPRENPLNQAK